MSSPFSNARRRFLQRRHCTIAETVPIQQLKAYRDECKEQRLSAECAMATTLIAMLRLDEAIRSRTLGEWMGQLGMLRGQIKNLYHALNVEFEAPGLKLAASQSNPEVSGK